MKKPSQSLMEKLERELIAISTPNTMKKVSEILSELDTSIISKNIQHKHPSFSKDSLIKLYLYKRTKGITTYP